MRVGVGGYVACVNSFSRDRIDVERCERATRTGEAALAPHRGRPGAIGGFLEGLGDGVEVVPLPFVAPGLGGPVTRDAQAAVEAAFGEALRAAPRLDGVFLQLHGGGAVEGGGDTDGALCAALREAMGENAPIVAVVDGHANVSPALFAAATAVIGVKTNPHHDFQARGRQAAAVLRALDAGRAIGTALAQPPMLPALQKQRIAPGWPMEDLVRAGSARMRADPRVLDVTVIGGWPYADCPHAGLSVLVATRDAPALADEVAGTLAATAWDRRREFLPHVVPVEDAVREAVSTDAWPVVLGDVADSGGAGTAGDGTAVLRALLEHNAERAVIGHLVDPEAVESAIRAGVGGRLAVTVGGKRDGQHGEPVAVEGRVRTLSDGEFRTSTAFNAGRQRRGPTAVLDCGGVEIILTSRDAHSFEPNTFRSVGIEPTERRILVAKSEMQHRAGLEAVGRTFIDVDAPGISTPCLERLPFRHLRRPVFPLDDDARYSGRPGQSDQAREGWAR